MNFIARTVLIYVLDDRSSAARGAPRAEAPHACGAQRAFLGQFCLCLSVSLSLFLFLSRSLSATGLISPLRRVVPSACLASDPTPQLFNPDELRPYPKSTTPNS